MRAYIEAHTDAVGSEAVRCSRCQQIVSLAEPLVMPFRGDGDGPHYDFLHAGETCPTVYQRGDVTLRMV